MGNDKDTQKKIDDLQTKEIVKGIKKDQEQDARLDELKNMLSSEAEVIEKLYSDFEAESSKIASIYNEVANLKLTDIKQERRDAAQDTTTKKIQENLDRNSSIDFEQMTQIKANANKIYTNFEYIYSIDKRLRKGRKIKILMDVLTAINFVGMIALYVLFFVR